MAVILARLGSFRQTQGRLDEARSFLEQALEIDRATIGPQHTLYAEHLTRYADVLHKLKRKAEAQEAERQARAIVSAGDTRSRVGQTVDVRALKQPKNPHQYPTPK